MGEEDEKDEDEMRAVITRKRRRQGPGRVSSSLILKLNSYNRKESRSEQEVSR